MPPSVLAQRRTHNILLLEKLLSLRDGASPFTLVVDTVQQSAHPVLDEFMVRAKVLKSTIIFVSFRTLYKPKVADIFVKARGKSLHSLGQEIQSHLLPPLISTESPPRFLVVFDSLNVLAYKSSSQLVSFLSSFLRPVSSLVAVFHSDIPDAPDSHENYLPNTLRTLTYLATAILSISSLSYVIAKKRSRDRSLEEPGSGLTEGKEGAILGLHRNSVRDVIIDMELRRKSGRGIKESFYFSRMSRSSAIGEGGEFNPHTTICLLDEYSGYASKIADEVGNDEEEGDVPETTFSLGLTEKQRRDREGIVLPYFDAQKGDGPGEGGRILYEMGREDDWDPEEDEI